MKTDTYNGVLRDPGTCTDTVPVYGAITHNPDAELPASWPSDLQNIFNEYKNLFSLSLTKINTECGPHLHIRVPLEGIDENARKLGITLEDAAAYAAIEGMHGATGVLGRISGMIMRTLLTDEQILDAARQLLTVTLYPAYPIECIVCGGGGKLEGDGEWIKCDECGGNGFLEEEHILAEASHLTSYLTSFEKTYGRPARQSVPDAEGYGEDAQGGEGSEAPVGDEGES